MGFQDKVKFGQLFFYDSLYNEKGYSLDWAKVGCIGIEMESCALYLNAARAGKRALCIWIVWSNMITKEGITAEERTKSLNDMIILALETAVSLK